MDIRVQLSTIKKLFIRLLTRFHVVLFVIVILGGLGIVILLLNSIIATSSDSTDYTSTSNNATFDQATINRINKLKTRDETTDQLDLSSGRTNPFVE